ncbi:hypothetical protein Acy02nite_56370 [Actinoplanes cyaneus]|uniref:Carboxymuconolactone decarboxylase family protein n=1 Tax=Actinoplanes cyaneus TaxID=52696 RepID=A0A919IMG8_9ACTN|nr:carboxymuconolactone decarboxylase family protein [Actinoplanes cyaneus]MCW2139949.1 hypothetical protein [Actinoplanes cyaneus]GID67756.1 hypothetical protein Acy02nite_56370 [Actinoplanes cyaneus]
MVRRVHDLGDRARRGAFLGRGRQRPSLPHLRAAEGRQRSVNRLQLSAWRESALFTPAERAALEYTEAATTLTGHGVSDEVWAGVRQFFDDEELGALVVQVALMNAYNRFGVPLRMPVTSRG